MKRSKTKTITITGIDGSGKSTITRKLTEMISSEKDMNSIVMNCPAYHNTPNAPLADLSEEMETFTTVSDAMGSYQLKAISLFLQISLFGPVENFFINTLQPSILINERHAVIDTLCYGDFYKKVMQDKVNREDLEDDLKSRLEKAIPGSYQSITQWVKLFSKRLGKTFDLWSISEHILETFTMEWDRQIPYLAEQFDTALPDIVLILDASAHLASERVDNRGDEQKELHENPEALEHLRQSYFSIVKFINESYPDVETHVIETGDKNTIDSTLDGIMGKIKQAACCE